MRLVCRCEPFLGEAAWMPFINQAASQIALAATSIGKISENSWIHFLLFSHLGIQRIPQTVSQQVETQHGQHDGHAWIKDHVGVLA